MIAAQTGQRRVGPDAQVFSRVAIPSDSACEIAARRPVG